TNGSSRTIIAEFVESETIPSEQVPDFETDEEFIVRHLVKSGNRDIQGADFSWLLKDTIEQKTLPVDVMVLERSEWGDFYGYLQSLQESGEQVALQAALAENDEANIWDEFQSRLDRVDELRDEIHDLEVKDIGAINYRLEALRLERRKLEMQGKDTPQALTGIQAERQSLEKDYSVLEKQLKVLYESIARDAITAKISDGSIVTIPLEKIHKAWRPNDLSFIDKVIFYFGALWDFISEDPREANTEGGVFPAIFGTVMMVLLMSVMVTPFGVVAAIYLREYAKQGIFTRIIRIAVNNLAGVPSIVYGIFGLGFFIYFLGGSIDQLFYAEALPAPTFGTPGLLWSSLTLAILTLPVVIVTTEEGLARIPRSLREGSIALGATKAETLWRVVLPMASPAIMTGLILAVARAAGEVAPLMLVGVVKLAPTLPLDGNFPYMHLDRKFMHLGFHIYDVGFQSPNVEAARPLVYATAFLLVLVIVVLNLSAIRMRNRLREKYRSLDN
ncbi:MAG: phosphate ABC transporter permease PstA, partial [Proteobacteria bacterium]|nr:phosphate ABC transporter permease PstA [Pseudomonadota bacterium]